MRDEINRAYRIAQALWAKFALDTQQTTFAMEVDGVHCTVSLPASEHKITNDPSVP